MENLIHDLTLVNNKVDSIAMVFNEYVVYRKTEDDFLKHLKEKQEKASDKQRTTGKDSK